MAVQAQYPSNVLLLNRNGQERKNMLGGDYSMQTQGGGFIDQSQVLFSNGAGGNPRKRGREAVASAAAAAATPINLFSLQPQPPPHPTVVNLAQLQNQQPAVVSTGLRLAPESHQQQMDLLLPSSIISSFLSEDLSTQMKQQRDEIDRFLQAQGDQLRRTLAEKRRSHYRALLAAAEESAVRRMREKEAEVEKAARRNAELEERAAQLKAEAQVWQARARSQEAAAASLQAQLQQAMMGGQAQDRRGEELGCAGGDNTPADDAESAYIDPGRAVSAVPVCRACRRRAVSVVLLPCRHLCLCTDCDTAVETCPLCHSVRSASVEVYLS
ncbi:BOI-related E3 ubiquitin-protein ligase 1-like [Magnolia sinica]|uniref:BOI-related E3 ubiquitin-protein ligase 1-like n=1 Tax=Magnolia sinica TaxID=86752 RepID=UPI00265B1C66|nr:BOI-related E3 ubiquitin-protein ligase 1-like [Magnolia sinica]